MSDAMADKTRRAGGLAAVLALAGAATMAAAGHALPPPEVSGNVRVNDAQQAFPQGNPGRMTSGLAASADGDNVLAVYEDLEGLCGPPVGFQCPAPSPAGFSAYSFSTDNGVTWTAAGIAPPIQGSITAGHPWADRLGRTDHNGRDKSTYFFVSRMQDPVTGLGSGLGIYRGRFRANTFAIEDSTLVNTPAPAGNFYSREAVAAAKDGSANAYMVLVNVDEICGVPFAGFGQIEMWRTHDGGDTWQGSAIVSPDRADILDPNNPNCGATGNLQIAPAVAIGNHGEVYAVWQLGPAFAADGSFALTDFISFSASVDGGETFTPMKMIAEINSMRQNPPVGYAKNRMNDQPRIAVDPRGGRIYVTFPSAVSPTASNAADQVLTSSQVLITHSNDRGRTWSTPTPLAPPLPPTGVKRFWPTVSVRPDGRVDVVYLESQEVETGTPCDVQVLPVKHRTGPASSLVDTFWVESRDGGETFSPPLKISTATSNWCLAPYVYAAAAPEDGALLSNAGDYIGSASTFNQTLAVWPDDRGGLMDTFFGAVTGSGRGPHRH
jgi:hypothetical protein